MFIACSTRDQILYMSGKIGGYDISKIRGLAKLGGLFKVGANNPVAYYELLDISRLEYRLCLSILTN